MKSLNQPRKLLTKQTAFVNEYAITGNAYQSALKAGYSDSTAKVKSAKWLENVRIGQAIEDRKRELAAESGEQEITPEVIVAGLFHEAKNAETASARVSAWRTLADIHGLTTGTQQQLPGALGLLVAGIRAGQEIGGKKVTPVLETNGQIHQEAHHGPAS